MITRLLLFPQYFFLRKTFRPWSAIALLLPLFSWVVTHGAETGKRTAEHPGYEFKEEHDPSGIGKFYLGREISHVMGHRGADWLEREERDEEERPDRMVASLGIRKGDSIADIGAGTGYITRRLANQTGGEGVVYAVDIQPEMLQLLQDRLLEESLHHVVPVLGSAKTPHLPPGRLDLVVMVDVYHEFSHPYEMLEATVRSLKPGGRVAFVEYRAEDPEVPIKRLHKMSEEQVKKEAAVHHLEWVETIGVLPRQHIVVFKRPE